MGHGRLDHVRDLLSASNAPLMLSLSFHPDSMTQGLQMLQHITPLTGLESQTVFLLRYSHLHGSQL